MQEIEQIIEGNKVIEPMLKKVKIGINEKIMLPAPYLVHPSREGYVITVNGRRYIVNVYPNGTMEAIRKA